MILHLDASPRPLVPGRDGSHTRRLSARFMQRWLAAAPHTAVCRRDLGSAPPSFPTAAFVEASLTSATQRSSEMVRALAESDALVDELIASDLIVAGVPMYNFAPPAQFKAYIDNVVRVGRTFGFDRAREPPYFPLLPAGKTLVLLSARGDYGYEPGQRAAHMNHVEPSIRTAFGYLGILDVRSIAIEYDEFPRDPRHAESVARAEAAVDALVDSLLVTAAPRRTVREAASTSG
ncbi:MAG: NAD(P)H-dependent oxidoreductase [Polyangiales bacterium]